MPIITQGLYKVILEQTYSAQTLLNTFFYLQSLGADDEQDLCAQAFDEDILPVLKDIQHSSLGYDNIRVVNVTGTLADFNRTPVTTDGVLTGVAVNSFTAVGIRLNRTTKETRNGQKRFAGQSEEVLNNQSFTAGYLTNVELVSDALVADISTVGGIFEPVIARQSKIDPLDWIINPVASGTVNDFVTSQVSRKRGKGI